MNNIPTDASVLVQSDRLCDEFEALFKRGQSPRIADFVSRVEVEHRGTLLRDLVALEIGLLALTGETSSVEELLKQYESLATAGIDREALRATIENALASTRNTKKIAAGLASTSPWDGRRTSSEVAFPTIEGFEIESVLGKGGMGVVYKSVQTSLGRTVALKMILDGAAATPEDLERFAREAKAVAELNDPHFVQIYEFGEAGGKPFMALEFAGGGSLERYRQGEPQPAKFAARTVEVLARAMHKAHVIGLVHRDLKPHNVLLADDGTPKIADFGLVKRQDPDESAMTEQGKVMGTASYMAPEQTYSSHDVGPAADVYALGGILYCLLTGRPPFLGATAHDTILAVRSTEVVLPSRLRPGTPRDLEVICLACLEKEPQKRYATAADLADDLRRYLEGRLITRRPVSTVERAWRWSKRNPLGATVTALVMAIAVISSLAASSLAALNSRLTIETIRANNEAKNATNALAMEQTARVAEQAARVERSIDYNKSLSGFKNVLVGVSKTLRNSTEEVRARKEINNIAMDQLRVLIDLDHPDTIYDRAAARNYQSIGELFFENGEVRKALEVYKWELRSIEETLKKEPDYPLHTRNLAAVLNHRAAALERLGETLQAKEHYERALQIRVQWNDILLAKGTDWVDAKKAIGNSHLDLGTINLLLGDGQAALEHLKQAQTWYAIAPANDVARQLASIDHRLGEAHYQIGNAKQAERHLLELQNAAVKKQSDVPTDANRRALARARLKLGDFYLSAPRDVGKAWSRYKLALDGYTRLWEQDQGKPETKFDLAAIEYRVGALLLRAKEAGIALNDVPDGNDPQTHFETSRKFRKELASIDPDDMQAKIEWALALARCGRAKEAAEQAEILVAKGENNPRLLSQAAATFALCTSARDAEVQDHCRKRAYEVLDQLLKSGWKDRAVLRDDPDFDPIRQEPRFQQLLASLLSLEAILSANEERTSDEVKQNPVN